MKLINNKAKVNFIMMVGISGSGKSTKAIEIANELTEENIPNIILSSDQLRQELLNDVNDQTQNSLIFQEMYKRTKTNLEKGVSVIYDATNLTIKNRRSILNIIENIDCKKIAYILPTPFFSCKLRNRNRERVVPEKVIENQRAKFEMPMYCEDFHEIIVDGYEENIISREDYILGSKKQINLFASTEYIGTLLADMSCFDQNNPHHDFSLLEHSIRVYEYIGERTKDKVLLTASLLHDFGKLFSKTEDENGISHYYNHANIGAYALLDNLTFFNTLFEWEDIVNCLGLINLHMQPFSWDKAKNDTVNKKRKFLGQDFFDKLVLLHQADEQTAKREGN